jgi:hydroxyacylglutathione hydrolase
MPSIIPVPAFRDNYIWLIVKDGRAAVVDPGDAAPVLAHLDREGLALAAILNTHHHGDHVGGNRALLERTPVPVFGPAGESIPGCTHPLREGDVVDVPGVDVRLRVLDVPGHTAGHIAYAGDVDGPVVFCGDTLFAAGCGRLFEGTAEQMWTSLRKLGALPPDTRAYCAHEYTLANLRFARAVEPDSAALAARSARDAATRDAGRPTVPSTIADELATNPFLRADEPGVRRAAEAHAGAPLAGAVASFAALRQWKNDFRG